jgi:acid phosphatase
MDKVPRMNREPATVRFGANVFLAAVLVLTGCATTGSSAPEVVAHDTYPPSWTVSVVDAALWVQTSSEYEAVTRQAYVSAAGLLREALADTSWTAALEQQPGYGSLPPAIIVDVDETVLDNVAYAARLVAAGEGYSDESWGAWVNQAEAPAVPGAPGFVRLARELGVEVFYVTNRNADLEDGTRRNLDNMGFPRGDADDVYLLKNEREGWGSDKTSRRAYVARDYRVVLLFGDDFNDFVSARAGLDAREALMAEHQAMWGSRWIMLPNPTYGSWERAITFGQSGLTRDETMERKIGALDPVAPQGQD